MGRADKGWAVVGRAGGQRELTRGGTGGGGSFFELNCVDKHSVDKTSLDVSVGNRSLVFSADCCIPSFGVSLVCKTSFDVSLVGKTSFDVFAVGKTSFSSSSESSS